MTNDDKSERTCHQVEVTSDGINFITCKGSRYVSLNYHRSSSGTSHQKSIWLIARADECHTLCLAEIFGWLDSDGNYWSTSKDAQVELGTRGERVAFFGRPQNAGDPFHGFPVGGRHGLPAMRKPPSDMIKLWMDAGWISYVMYSRLMGGRL
jgi:hypothetical protein